MDRDYSLRDRKQVAEIVFTGEEDYQKNSSEICT